MFLFQRAVRAICPETFRSWKVRGLLDERISAEEIAGEEAGDEEALEGKEEYRSGEVAKSSCCWGEVTRMTAAGGWFPCVRCESSSKRYGGSGIFWPGQSAAETKSSDQGGVGGDTRSYVSAPTLTRRRTRRTGRIPVRSAGHDGLWTRVITSSEQKASSSSKLRLLCQKKEAQRIRLTCERSVTKKGEEEVAS